MRNACWRVVVAVLATFWVVMAPVAWGQEAAKPQYVMEVKLVQALTNIEGNGLTSQTLPGMQGWFQIIHQKLDGVDLVMEGDKLTWNGKETPDNPMIISIFMPGMTTQEGQEVTVLANTAEPIQYLTQKKGNLYELHTLDPKDPKNDLGYKLKLTPTAGDQPNLVNGDLDFSYQWVKDRAKLEGVSLPVGEPVLGKRSVQGAVKMELGSWSCLTVDLPSQGQLYIFIKCTRK